MIVIYVYTSLSSITNNFIRSHSFSFFLHIHTYTGLGYQSLFIDAQQAACNFQRMSKREERTDNDNDNEDAMKNIFSHVCINFIEIGR